MAAPKALDQEPEPQCLAYPHGNGRTQSLPECTQPRHTGTRSGIKENTDGKPLKHFREHFEDPRRTNRSYRASSLLVFITMALFAGRDTLTSIQRYGNLLTGQQRLWLSFL